MRLLPLFLLLACDSAKDPSDTAAYHPADFALPAAHSISAKLQEDRCTSCHGADLTGGDQAEQVSCDTCHAADWRTTCTFCHGGVDDSTGAPPEDIRDNLDTSAMSFPAHTAHGSATALHVPFDCTQCHVKPTDAMDDGHLFVGDSTAGVAEMDFSQGLSSSASWSGTGCSNLYCHGSGQGDDGAVEATDSVGCGDCHAGPDDSSAWSQMSGKHRDHLNEGIHCESCHSDTATEEGEISDTTQHIDAEVDVHLPPSMAISDGECTGTCHSEDHDGRTWD